MRMLPFFIIIMLSFLSTGATAQLSGTDPHSYAQPERAVVNHLALDLTVNFQKKVISGKATWHITQQPGVTEIIFDTRDLNIRKITTGEPEKPASFMLGAEQQYLGKSLTVSIPSGTSLVNIYYSTSPEAAALQWLSPQQTGGRVHPFLYTQSQAILARSWIPCQDGPGIRFTYEADLHVPSDLLPLMSAANPQEKNKSGKYHFSMEQPIPSYLLALAVGDIAFKPLSANTGVYAEPSMLEKAAWEFADIPNMVAAAEQLYGSYRWGRYDVIVLPPSFPFGGMENPRLTFATPTVIAGDRSLVSLISHELAHSWSGNLVTNATWNDFWLNEGFTVYFERRIDELLYGKEVADMEWALGKNDLSGELEDLGENNRDSWLKLELTGRDPDDGMSGIAYEKGALLLRCIELTVGRVNMDSFLNDYFSAHAFQSLNTEQFLQYLTKALITPNEQAFSGLDLHSWIYGPGLPDACAQVVSSRFLEVDVQIRAFEDGVPCNQLKTENWVAHQWIYFLNAIPEKLTIERMKELDAEFGFTESGNSEIAVSWLLLSIGNQYRPAYPKLDSFLSTVGRRKFLLPLYRALIQTEQGKIMAADYYRKYRQNYHSVAVGSLDEMLQWKSDERKTPY